jgi:hypothetical protein
MIVYRLNHPNSTPCWAQTFLPVKSFRTVVVWPSHTIGIEVYFPGDEMYIDKNLKETAKVNVSISGENKTWRQSSHTLQTHSILVPYLYQWITFTTILQWKEIFRIINPHYKDAGCEIFVKNHLFRHFKEFRILSQLMAACYNLPTPSRLKVHNLQLHSTPSFQVLHLKYIMRHLSRVCYTLRSLHPNWCDYRHNFRWSSLSSMKFIGLKMAQ